jgi:sugar-specific transcriptional regulator TrmB
MNRTETYRTLRNLQKRGIVESTLEHPVRFQAVPFEKCIDILLDARRELTDELEEQAKRLKSHFRELSISAEVPALERFQVLEGRQRIEQRLMDMFSNARLEIAAILTPGDIVRADTSGTLELLKSRERREKPTRLITEITQSNLHVVEQLRNGVEVRHMDLVKKPIPRVSMIDGEEALFSISTPDDAHAASGDEVALWIASKSFVRNLKAYFREIWESATPAAIRAESLRIGLEPEEIRILKGRPEVRSKLSEMMNRAGKSLDIWTTENGIDVLAAHRLANLKELRSRNARVRLIAPLTKDNIEGARRLAAVVELRHSEALGPARVVIVDNKELMLYERVPDDQSIVEGRDVGFWTTSVPFIETMARVYDALWKGTLGIYPQRRGLRMVGKTSTAR